MWWAHRTPSQAHTPTSIFPKCLLRSLLAKTNLSVQHSIGFPHKGDFYFLDTPSDVNGKQILSLQLSGKMQQLIGFRPGNVNGLLSSSNCSFVGHITLREELFFVFLSEEDKRVLCSGTKHRNVKGTKFTKKGSFCGSILIFCSVFKKFFSFTGTKFEVGTTINLTETQTYFTLHFEITFLKADQR